MDAKSKILLSAFVVLVVISAVLTYYRTIILRDYPVINSDSTESASSKS